MSLEAREMLVLALSILVLIMVGDNMEVSKKASYKSERKAGSLGGESLQPVEARWPISPPSR